MCLKPISANYVISLNSKMLNLQFAFKKWDSAPVKMEPSLLYEHL